MWPWRLEVLPRPREGLPSGIGGGGQGGGPGLDAPGRRGGAGKARGVGVKGGQLFSLRFPCGGVCYLVEIADPFASAYWEVIVICNAGAARQGGNAGAARQEAPATTMDFDSLYRRFATNETILRKVTQILGGHLAVRGRSTTVLWAARLRQRWLRADGGTWKPSRVELAAGSVSLGTRTQHRDICIPEAALRRAGAGGR